MPDLRHQLESTLAGSYALERELGGGGMSRVFLADELRFGRRVVMKVLSPELAAGISAERFEREIRLAASLQQANIVPVLSAGEASGLPYYTMPYVEGESLRSAIAGKSPLAIADIVGILGDVARALKYAHEKGVVHRDIKPENVLLSGGTAVVTDFGIAKAIRASRTGGAEGGLGGGGGGGGGGEGGDGTRLTRLGISLGTPDYMAPEQAAGDPDVDARADIYALGCVAYELLTGHPPFHDRAPQRILAAHLTEPPVPVSELRPDTPPALAELVMRALAKDPADRPQNAAEVILALNTVSSGSGMAALPPTVPNGPAAFRAALLVYLGAAASVAVIAKTATINIELPDWVFPGTLILLALGFLVILFAGYVHHAARRALGAVRALAPAPAAAPAAAPATSPAAATVPAHALARSDLSQSQNTTPAPTPGGSPRPRSAMTALALRVSPHLSWKRVARGGIYTLGAFGVGIIVLMTMHLAGIGPLGSLLAAGKLEQRDAILVADFGVSGADSSVGRVAAEGVRANLGQSSAVTVVSPVTVAVALRRMRRPPAEPLYPGLARQIAVREGFKAIVTGDVTRVGTGFVISLRLVSADSGNVLASYQTTVSGLSELVGGVDQVTRKLRRKIGESLESVRASPPLADVTTASYDALEAYTEGARAFDEGQDYKTAIPLLQQAVAIDPRFATAWRKLAMAYANSGYPQSMVDSAVTKAFRLRRRLAASERYMVEGSYYSTGPGHDRKKAADAYRTLLARGDSDYAANNLASIYISRRDYAQAEPLLRAALRRSPGAPITLQNLEFVLVARGEKSAADSLLRAWSTTVPGSPDLLFMRIMRSYLDDGVARAETLADSIGRTTTSADVRMRIGYYRTMFALLRGRLARGERLLHRSNALEREQGIVNAPAIADSLMLITVSLWSGGAPRTVARRLDAALAAAPLSALPAVDRPYGDAGALYAMVGRVSEARSVLARIEQLGDTALRRALQPDAKRVLAEIAMAEDRPRDALTEFRGADRGADGPLDADPLPMLFHLGRAFDLAREPDLAIVLFERYLATPYLNRLPDDMLWLPTVQKRLGELYEAKGDSARAALHYAAFVTLRAHADPELQREVTEVERRLARLSEGGKR